MDQYIIYQDNLNDFNDEFEDYKKMGYRPIGGIAIAYHREHQCMYFSIIMIKGR
jgi:hypothetical protein